MIKIFVESKISRDYVYELVLLLIHFSVIYRFLFVEVLHTQPTHGVVCTVRD